MMVRSDRQRNRTAVRGLLGAGMLMVLMLMLAACGTGQASPSGTPEAQGAAPGDYQPVTIESCGMSTTYQEPPERAVTLNQHATEVMLTLGLEDRMVGTAYLDDGVLPELQDAYSAVPVIAEEYPSKEVLVGVEPDFAYGGFSSAFSDEGVGSREGLDALGIDSYLAAAFCPERAQGPVTMDLVYEDILNIGHIFGVEDRAESVVESMRQEIDAVSAELESVDQPLRVFVYDSGDTAPFTAACCGTAAAVIDLAGGRNIFDDVDGSWASVSWEEVVQRDPEVIVLIDAVWSPAEDKRELLLSNPALSSVDAVQDESFVTVPFSYTVPGARTGVAVRQLAEGFYPERFD